jgi:hypothetical protein
MKYDARPRCHKSVLTLAASGYIKEVLTLAVSGNIKDMVVPKWCKDLPTKC